MRRASVAFIIPDVLLTENPDRGRRALLSIVRTEQEWRNGQWRLPDVTCLFQYEETALDHGMVQVSGVVGVGFWDDMEERKES